jgi:hypothetical protein
MNDISGLNLNETPQVNWDNFNPQPEKKGGSYQTPPVPFGPDGKRLTYYLQLPSDMGKVERQRATKAGDRSFSLGPLTVVKSQNGSDGYTIRFYDASVKLFNGTDKEGNPIVLNVNAIGKVLRAAGITARPQTDQAYCQAVAQLGGRVIPAHLEWEARDRDSNFEVKGYNNFNVTRTDPKTGVTTTSVQPILRRGDILPDGTVITQEVLFANAVVKSVLDPTRK